MKKRIFAVAFAMTLALSCSAQIFVAEEEQMGKNLRNTTETPWRDPMVRDLGEEHDQYTPLGEGVIALSILGGAYLLGKRRKKD